MRIFRYLIAILAVAALAAPAVASAAPGTIIVFDDLDNGRGFRPDAVDGGFGLDSMRQRADLIGATLSISSQPRDGSRVEVVLPLPGEERPGGG